MAHKIPASVMAMNELGRLGIKTVDSDDMVAFHEIDIVQRRLRRCLGFWITFSYYDYYCWTGISGSWRTSVRRTSRLTRDSPVLDRDQR